MSIARNTLKQVLLDNQKDVEQYEIFHRHYDLDSFPLMIFVGVRRSGKSFLLFQKIRQLLAAGKGWDEILYLDFEDTRLDGFTADDYAALVAKMFAGEITVSNAIDAEPAVTAVTVDYQGNIK